MTHSYIIIRTGVGEVELGGSTFARRVLSQAVNVFNFQFGRVPSHRVDGRTGQIQLTRQEGKRSMSCISALALFGFLSVCIIHVSTPAEMSPRVHVRPGRSHVG